MQVTSRYPVPGWAGQAQLADALAAASAQQGAASATATAASAAAAAKSATAASAAANQAASTLQSMLSENFEGPSGPAPLAALSAWVPNTPYVVGPPASFVSYDGSSYACVVSHTSSGAFDPTKWAIVAAKGNDGADGSIDLQDFPPAGSLLKATPTGLSPAVAGTDYLAPNTIFDAGTV